MKRLIFTVYAVLAATALMAACDGIPGGGSGDGKAEDAESVEIIMYNQNKAMNKMNITVNGKTMTATLADNSSAAALVALLEQGPLTYQAHDYGNFEKVGYIGHSLPRNDEYIATVPGDIILYQGSNICLYYDTNEWDFTRLGKIDNLSANEIRSILGTGDCTVTLSLAGETAVKQVEGGTASGGKTIHSLDGRTLVNAPEKGIYIEKGIKKSGK
ncbi:MAG: cyclophilin-like fold protein [Bacteroidales bacterium]|nr:cyclophilin-like fold protein [Bacteroidales bacterium]MCM1148202.1 cyclophilin-like fold protein [Bacteroidales bacterium]MCM1207071.1 cyclophilin-like fold protein [Bacillota bacterium]MCM1510815.1 cyclophilin-like fold protein [Clostridium sp.]